MGQLEKQLLCLQLTGTKYEGNAELKIAVKVYHTKYKIQKWNGMHTTTKLVPQSRKKLCKIKKRESGLFEKRAGEIKRNAS